MITRLVREDLPDRYNYPMPGGGLESGLLFIAYVFTKFWNMTPHADCANKPTVHDFRFTFVVNRMNLWAEKGVDLKVMMPYLSRYLGHKTTKETFYYYYLVSDAYRTVDNKDSIACDVIPEVMRHG